MKHRWIIGIALVTVAMWCGASVLLCENAIRAPRRSSSTILSRSITPKTADIEDVQTIGADGVLLKGSFVSNRSATEDCVLLLHGIADSRVSSLGFGDMFIKAGYSVLAADSRAHGASGGELITYGVNERIDVLRWAAWLRRRGCLRLYGLGESMGGAILIQAAAQEAVFVAIVAECPFRDLRTIAEERIVQVLPGPKPLLRIIAKTIVPSGFLYARLRYGLDLEDAAPAVSTIRLRTPLLLIHGLEDVNISPAHSQAIAAAGRMTELWLVPGAGHNAASACAPIEFRNRVLRWFEVNRSLSDPKSNLAGHTFGN